MIARRAVAAAAVCVLAACARPATPRPTLDDDARQYVRLVVALGERDPDSIDFYAGPSDLMEDVRRHPPALPAIERDARDLASRVGLGTAGDADAARRRDLVRDLGSLAARARLLLGERLPYDRESRALFGVVPPPFDEARQKTVLAQVAAELPGGGALVDRYVAFTRQFVVPPDRLAALMAAALEGCRDRTRTHLGLPPGEHASIVLVNNKPWSAYSRYQGGGHSVISVNTDFSFTVDQALQMACHEGYPGHHARSTLLDARLVHGRGWPEFSAQATFSAGSLVSEATAMYAGRLAFPAAERIRFERERLLPLAGIPAARGDAIGRHIRLERLVERLQDVQEDVARRYLDGDLEFARAATRLEREALLPRAESALKYINEYRSYVTTYTSGAAAVAAFMETCAAETAPESDRWGCFERLLMTSGPIR